MIELPDVWDDLIKEHSYQTISSLRSDGWISVDDYASAIGASKESARRKLVAAEEGGKVLSQRFMVDRGGIFSRVKLYRPNK